MKVRLERLRNCRLELEGERGGEGGGRMIACMTRKPTLFVLPNMQRGGMEAAGATAVGRADAAAAAAAALKLLL